MLNCKIIKSKTCLVVNVHAVKLCLYLVVERLGILLDPFEHFRLLLANDLLEIFTITSCDF